jgi:aspartate/methionine/tyrosine aminotransferase
MEVTRIANELKKKGAKIYPFSAGDTHFSPPQIIFAKLNKLDSAYSHYTNAIGIDSLREQIAQNLDYYSANDIILVPGLKQGFFYCLLSIQKKTLCILEPAWLGYEASASLANMETVSINIQEKNWLQKLGETTFDAIMVCSPNNPDGKIITGNEIEEIIKVAQKNDAWIIADLIYDKFCFEQGYQEFYSKLNTYEKLIIGNGFSKSHAMTGFRIGYLAVKNSEIRNKILVLQQNIATCVSSIAQFLLANSKDVEDEIKSFVEYYKANRNFVCEVFPEWQIYKPNGGFYYFVDLKEYGIIDSKLFCEELLQNTGIALIHGSAYGKGFDSFVRLSFSISFEQLKEGLLLLKEYLQNYKNNS